MRRGDATRPGDWWDGEQFGATLVDVPCSATGIMRTRPEVLIVSDSKYGKYGKRWGLLMRSDARYTGYCLSYLPLLTIAYHCLLYLLKVRFHQTEASVAGLARTQLLMLQSERASCLTDEPSMREQ